jgi:hypothetical protein
MRKLALLSLLSPVAFAGPDVPFLQNRAKTLVCLIDTTGGKAAQLYQ